MFQAETENDFEDWTEAMSVLIEKIERKNGFGQLNNNNTCTMEDNNEGKKKLKLVITILVIKKSATKIMVSKAIKTWL